MFLAVSVQMTKRLIGVLKAARRRPGAPISLRHFPVSECGAATRFDSGEPR